MIFPYSSTASDTVERGRDSENKERSKCLCSQLLIYPIKVAQNLGDIKNGSLKKLWTIVLGRKPDQTTCIWEVKCIPGGPPFAITVVLILITGSPIKQSHLSCASSTSYTNKGWIHLQSFDSVRLIHCSNIACVTRESCLRSEINLLKRNGMASRFLPFHIPLNQAVAFPARVGGGLSAVHYVIWPPWCVQAQGQTVPPAGPGSRLLSKVCSIHSKRMIYFFRVFLTASL